ncbi:MAG: hypothetical protein GXO49_08370, partial [Chlorobi bacterium]|nr:hypothetical protein [Chlorobiota bacterium]
WSSNDGQLIASFNPQPKAAALFNTVTSHINNSLRDGGLPSLNKYYMLDLDEDSLILVVIFDDFQMGMLVNSNKVQLGLLLNVVMPKARESFLEAIK